MVTIQPYLGKNAICDEKANIFTYCPPSGALSAINFCHFDQYTADTMAE
jgi:hypothetical protein